MSQNITPYLIAVLQRKVFQEKEVENRVQILEHLSYLFGGMVTVAEYVYRQVGATGQSSWLLAVR